MEKEKTENVSSQFKLISFLGKLWLFNPRDMPTPGKGRWGIWNDSSKSSRGVREEFYQTKFHQRKNGGGKHSGRQNLDFCMLWQWLYHCQQLIEKDLEWGSAFINPLWTRQFGLVFPLKDKQKKLDKNVFVCLLGLRHWRSKRQRRTNGPRSGEDDGQGSKPGIFTLNDFTCGWWGHL